MKTKLVSGMTRIFTTATITTLIALVSACSLISFDSSDMEATMMLQPFCRDTPCAEKGTCRCSLADSNNPNIPACCNNDLISNNPCGRQTADPTSQMAGTCQVSPSLVVGVIGASMLTIDDITTGSFKACEPFKVVWTYRNYGNQTAAVPAAGLLGPKLEISESPADLVGQPFTPVEKDIPWSTLAPGSVETKSEMFAGIKPDNPDQTGTFRATFKNIPAATTVSQIQFDVGFFGSDCK
jgi:hypothetical protein